MNGATTANGRGVGPRGTGHDPSVDPWKGLRGVMAGTLVMEAIVIGLVLTVIARIDDGAHFQTWKIVYVSALAIAMVVAVDWAVSAAPASASRSACARAPHRSADPSRTAGLTPPAPTTAEPEPYEAVYSYAHEFLRGRRRSHRLRRG